MHLKKGALKSKLPQRGEAMRISVLIYREGEVWVAHALEFDIVATGQSKEEALGNLKDLVNAQIEFAMLHGNLEAIFKPAPSEYWARYFSEGFSTKEAPLTLETEVKECYA